MSGKVDHCIYYDCCRHHTAEKSGPRTAALVEEIEQWPDAACAQDDTSILAVEVPARRAGASSAAQTKKENASDEPRTTG